MSQENPQIHISVEKRQEILNEVGTIEDAFELDGYLPHMLANKGTKGWQPRLMFKLHDGVIDDSTLELIEELQKDGNKVSIGLPHKDTPPNARLILFQ